MFLAQVERRLYYIRPIVLLVFLVESIQIITHQRVFRLHVWSLNSLAGKDMVPEQEVKVQEAPEARRQPARQRPNPGLHVPLPALPDHPTDMGRLGLFQRSKHGGQQLHARLLSLVFLPASRLDAEIERWRRPVCLEASAAQIPTNH